MAIVLYCKKVKTQHPKTKTQKKQKMKAMIFAAGLGTRLYPITKTLPKALAPYRNKPLLQHVIEKITQAGFDEIVINVHHFSQKVIDFLSENDNFGTKIIISDETDQLLETGGGLHKAAKYLQDAPFLVHNVDIISDINLVDFYQSHQRNNALATLAVQNRFSNKKLYFNEQKELCKWKNEQNGEEKIVKNCISATGFAFSGIHVISPKIFDYMSHGIYSIIDTYLYAAQKEKITYYDHSGQKWADMGRPENLLGEI